MSIAARYDDLVTIPRAARFPIEMVPPEGFDPERQETWPRVEGRLEYLNDRLLFMPPCGDIQQDTVADVVHALVSWARSQTDFVVGTNEAGMRLAGATRGADVAVWRRSDLAGYTGGFRRVAPVLAVEVGGEQEGDTEADLRAKAAWYLAVGTIVVWVVLPGTKEVLVVTNQGEQRLGIDDQVPLHPALPGLSPTVSDLFRQLIR